MHMEFRVKKKSNITLDADGTNYNMDRRKMRRKKAQDFF